MKSRKPQEIIDQTNELARKLYSILGYQVVVGYRFDRATHLQENTCWRMASCAQAILTDTDVRDALDEVEE